MQIRRLTLERVRRFDRFVFHPQPGINCLIGPGDSGKTTILEAIARATSPAPAGPASEHDYRNRQTEAGFELELVIGGLSRELASNAARIPPCWGWRGPDQEILDAPVQSEPVLRLLVRGTADLEIEHRLLTPNGEEVPFSAEKRRMLGLCRVGEMRGSSREFRMARGSLLERTLGRDEVRGAAARAVRSASAQLDLPADVEERLKRLEEILRREGIASERAVLEVLSPPGQSLLGLLGVALGEPGSAIPLTYSGQGAQRLASYLLATELADAPALLVMDEVEVGLEPYRQRLLVQRLRRLVRDGGQAFLTTHSPAVLEELDTEELHRLHVEHVVEPSAAEDAEAPVRISQRPTIVRLSPPLTRIKENDPEALICALPGVCEGLTEVVLLRALLDGLTAAAQIDLAALGFRLVGGGGQPQLFDVVKALRNANFQVAVFLDEEEQHSGQRAALNADSGVVVGRFTSGRSTEHALAAELSEAALDELLEVGSTSYAAIGTRRRHQLNYALGKDGRLAPSELAAVHGWDGVREAIGQTAHGSDWFKSRADAEALAEWLGDGRLPAQMHRDLVAFYEALKPPLGLPAAKAAHASAEQ